MTAFAPETLTEHGFLGGQVHVFQPREGYRSGVDAVYLAAAAPAVSGESVLDLGAGAGVASFCLGARVAGVRLHALEIQKSYALLAERNATATGIALSVYHGDVSNPPTVVKALSVDGVIANPPYFRIGEGRASDAKGAAHSETVPLSVWIDCALRRLVPGGWVVMIQRAERLAELLSALQGRAGDIHIKPIAGRSERAATRVIVKARKGAKGKLTLCAPLIEHDGAQHRADGDDDYSPAAKAVLRDGAALDFL